ncbi:hypothetical protein DVH24_000560 [Malus domestica]|uniref:Uncharacterized protein n=1 Tax=Malus domestica TaxID=3750 RepID=A0A498J675_MALDO|nr:hypothetical protein DVH24_000560 [Malus domestica]
MTLEFPIEIHQEERSMSHTFLMSSNYDNTVKKTTGGRKGYGAKLTSSPPSSSSRWRTKCDRRSVSRVWCV